MFIYDKYFGRIHTKRAQYNTAPRPIPFKSTTQHITSNGSALIYLFFNADCLCLIVVRNLCRSILATFEYKYTTIVSMQSNSM